VINATDIYRIIDLTDVISQEIRQSISYRSLSSRMLYNVELPRIEWYERWVAENINEIWLISEHDRSVLSKACPKANIQVIPHWVNIEKFSPIDVRVVPNSIIFVGNMSVSHNVDAVTYLARDIFPLVRTEIPNCIFKIVGASPCRQILNLTRIPGIEVTGFVPDLNMILNQSAVFVAPLRFSAGVQNKVIEAMAAGRPVITTSLVNQGLGAMPNRDLIISEGASETANTIITLLGDTCLRKELGQSARKFVVQHSNRDLVRERLKQIIST
jgi:glycosyltransferase involved in cell wall biosynthesis